MAAGLLGSPSTSSDHAMRPSLRIVSFYCEENSGKAMTSAKRYLNSRGFSPSTHSAKALPLFSAKQIPPPRQIIETEVKPSGEVHETLFPLSLESDSPIRR